MKLYIINGPNLNMLGIREPEQYGKVGYEELVLAIERYCDEKGIEYDIFQSNHEGALVDKIQEAYFSGADGIVINPGAYTHTSIALLDAAKAVRLPLVEVHISKVEEREAYRQISYIREAAVKTVSGKGIAGYFEAIDFLVSYIDGGKNEN